MNAEMIALIVKGVIEYGPAFGRGLHAIFTLGDKATLADWEKYVFVPAEKSYADYVAPKS